MRVYLVQHGEAQPKKVDPDRHLTPRGTGAVQRVAEFLKPLELCVRAIWQSGKPRARQTAELLAAGVSARDGIVERPGLGPNDDVEPIAQAIVEAGEDAMVVGHLPFLGRLAAQLVAGDADVGIVAFRYGGVVCMEQQDDRDWRIAWMVTPATLGR